jgi:hypothetical protein
MNNRDSQRDWQHWVYKTQNEDKQNKKNTTQKAKTMSNIDPNRNYSAILATLQITSYALGV